MKSRKGMSMLRVLGLAAFICVQSGSGMPVSASETTQAPVILQASDYHEGIVWAKTEQGDTACWSAVDDGGTVLFSLEPEEIPVTSFCNGISIVDYQYVVDAKGNTVWSVEKDGWDFAREQWGDSVEEIHLVNNWKSSVNAAALNDTPELLKEDFFGYPQVEFYVNTFDYSGNYTGFLNPDGSWRREPETMRASVLDGRYGVYRMFFPDDSWKEGHYNMLTDETVDTDQMDEESYYKAWGRWGAEYYAGLHDGLIYVSAGALGDYVYGGLDLESYDRGFYDLSGNMQIDLGKYHLAASPYPAFADGYALLQLENEQKAPFYTLMDKSGNFVFEPRKKGIFPFEMADAVSEGMYWVRNEDNAVTYYKTDGEPAFETEFTISEARDFHDGRALVKTDAEEWHFIDTSGKIVW